MEADGRSWSQGKSQAKPCELMLFSGEVQPSSRPCLQSGLPQFAMSASSMRTERQRHVFAESRPISLGKNPNSCKQYYAARPSLKHSDLRRIILHTQTWSFRGQILSGSGRPRRCSGVRSCTPVSAQATSAQFTPTKSSGMSRLINGWRTDNLIGDIYGGLTAAVVALPLALAFGVASGKLLHQTQTPCGVCPCL